MHLTLAELIRRFDSGEIRLPLMQRDYVWKPRKVVALLDSLYRSWPIGSFYIWQSREEHAARARRGRQIEGKARDGLHGFLLDGQQRLTSLSLALQGEADGDFETRGFFDLESQIFQLGASGVRVRKRWDKGDPALVPLSEIVVLWDGDSDLSADAIQRRLLALEEQQRLGAHAGRRGEFEARLQRVAAMLQRPALADEFNEEDEESAFELFARLNKGGTSLQAGDVAAARLASTGTRGIVAPMRALAADADIRAMGINFMLLMRALITVYRGNCKFSDLPRSWASDASKVEAAWATTESALRHVVQFVREEMGWTNRRWLPSTMSLIPLVYLFALTGTEHLDERERNFLRRYLLIAGLRGLFTGATETTVNAHLAAIREASGGRLARTRALFERIPKIRRTKLRKEDLLVPSGSHSAIMQVYLSMLHNAGARSWPSGIPIADADGGAGSSAVVHFIFPKGMALELNQPAERFHVPANCAIVNNADHQAMAGDPPLEVWNRMRHSQRELASLQLGFVASDNLLRPVNFDEFLEYRAAKMAEQLNTHIGLG